MKQEYITKNPYLKGGLLELGFKKKNINSFCRPYNDCVQMINFGHSTRNEHYVRYYGIIVGARFPKVEEFGNKLDVMIGSIGTDIGNLMPNYNHKVWRVTNSDSIDYIQQVANDMLVHIVKYAIPFLNKYSTIKELIKGIENNDKNVCFVTDYNLPVLYLMDGEKELAFSHIERVLGKYELSGKYNRSDIAWYDSNLINPNTTNRFYDAYRIFSNKLRDLTKEEETRGM